jgi:hypothetical protein
MHPNAKLQIALDITPKTEMSSWNSDEYNSLSVCWYTEKNFDKIKLNKLMFSLKHNIFGLRLNGKKI